MRCVQGATSRARTKTARRDASTTQAEADDTQLPRPSRKGGDKRRRSPRPVAKRHVVVALGGARLLDVALRVEGGRREVAVLAGPARVAAGGVAQGHDKLGAVLDAVAVLW